MLLIFTRFSPFVQIVMPYWESKPVISGRRYAPVVGVGIGMESRDDITALGIRANIGKSLFTVQKNAFTVNTFRYGEFYVYLEKLFARMGSGRFYGGVELGGHWYEEISRRSFPDTGSVSLIEAAKRGNLTVGYLYLGGSKPLKLTLSIPFVADRTMFNVPRITWKLGIYLR